MKLTSKPLALIIMLLMFGGIAFSTAMNWWRTESTKEPARFASGEAAGEYNPADIRGSYTFGDIQRTFDVPLGNLAEAFAPAVVGDPASFQVKSLEVAFATLETEIGTSSVRLFVAFYRGLPYELDGDIYLPVAAVNILKEKAQLTAEQAAYLDNHTVTVNPGETTTLAVPESAVLPTPDKTSSSSLLEIKGKTTFQEILDAGLSEEAISAITGAPLPAPGMKVKDYCIANGLSFETVKTALQNELSKIP